MDEDERVGVLRSEAGPLDLEFLERVTVELRPRSLLALLKNIRFVAHYRMQSHLHQYIDMPLEFSVQTHDLRSYQAARSSSHVSGINIHV